MMECVTLLCVAVRAGVCRPVLPPYTAAPAGVAVVERSTVLKRWISRMVRRLTCVRQMSTSERVIEEAVALTRLSHPHVARVYGFCPTSPVGLVMDYYEMGSLADWIRKHPDVEVCNSVGVRPVERHPFGSASNVMVVDVNSVRDDAA